MVKHTVILYVRVCLFVCMHVCLFVCMHVWIGRYARYVSRGLASGESIPSSCMYACMYKHIHNAYCFPISEYVRVYVCMYACISMYIMPTAPKIRILTRAHTYGVYLCTLTEFIYIRS
jgi:hypothetical protein